MRLRDRFRAERVEANLGRLEKTRKILGVLESNGTRDTKPSAMTF